MNESNKKKATGDRDQAIQEKKATYESASMKGREERE
jgi:hypothetical protein